MVSLKSAFALTLKSRCVFIDPIRYLNLSFEISSPTSFSKAFYNLLDNGGASKIGDLDTNKENVDGHYSEIEQTQYNPYNSSSANPYSQRKQIVTPYPPNPYNQSNRQMQYSVPINERTSPVPHTASLSSSTSSATTLTPKQIKRIEENRQRALAIRLNKQNQYMP